MERNNIYSPLPNVVAERSAGIINLPPSGPDTESMREELKELVQTWVPKSDQDEVESEVS